MDEQNQAEAICPCPYFGTQDTPRVYLSRKEDQVIQEQIMVELHSEGMIEAEHPLNLESVMGEEEPHSGDPGTIDAVVSEDVGIAVINTQAEGNEALKKSYQ